ncbi:MAG: hypothetical protein ACRELA_00715 [Candidatus Rokuibacteriota bacterium]
MTTVLFACTHNAGRSQMAAAFFNQPLERVRAIRDEIHRRVERLIAQEGWS